VATKLDDMSINVNDDINNEQRTISARATLSTMSFTIFTLRNEHLCFLKPNHNLEAFDVKRGNSFSNRLRLRIKIKDLQFNLGVHIGFFDFKSLFD
jgi:hypothetical protein